MKCDAKVNAMSSADYQKVKMSQIRFSRPTDTDCSTGKGTRDHRNKKSLASTLHFNVSQSRTPRFTIPSVDPVIRRPSPTPTPLPNLRPPRPQTRNPSHPNPPPRSPRPRLHRRKLHRGSPTRPSDPSLRPLEFWCCGRGRRYDGEYPCQSA
jgi:hypothetical protein